MSSGASRWLNQKSAPCGVSKSRGATPPTVLENSANRIGLPMTAGSALYNVRQALYEITTTGGLGCGGVLGGGGGGWTKFSCVKPPEVMGRPNSSKKPSVTPYTVTCWGVPSVLRSVRSFDCSPAACTMDTRA